MRDKTRPSRVALLGRGSSTGSKALDRTQPGLPRRSPTHWQAGQEATGGALR
jgi:hypothetical protein